MCLVYIAMPCFFREICGDTFEIAFPKQWKIGQSQEELGSCLWQQCLMQPCVNRYQGVWKLVTVMKDDDISAADRSDFCFLQLAQSFFNKHGQDPTKYDYIRQKLREVGRLLLILRREFSIQTLEDAVRPASFKVLIQAVKKVSGFNDEITPTRLQALLSSWVTH